MLHGTNMKKNTHLYSEHHKEGVVHRCPPTGGEEHEEIKSFSRSYIIVVVNVRTAYVYLEIVQYRAARDFGAQLCVVLTTGHFRM
jgi:hypothetical protein